MQNPITSRKIKEKYKMQPHPEGGFYAPFYKSGNLVRSDLHDGDRAAMTSIHYLLTDKDFSAFHRLNSDEIWHYYEGNTPVMIHVFSPIGEYHKVVLGRNCADGYQYIIPARSWFAAELIDKRHDSYVFVGCTVSPGFEFCDFEIANGNLLAKEFNQYKELILALTRNL